MGDRGQNGRFWMSILVPRVDVKWWNVEFLMFGETEWSRARVQKDAQSISGHFCLVTNLSIAIWSNKKNDPFFLRLSWPEYCTPIGPLLDPSALGPLDLKDWLMYRTLGLATFKFDQCNYRTWGTATSRLTNIYVYIYIYIYISHLGLWPGSKHSELITGRMESMGGMDSWPSVQSRWGWIFWSIN